MPPSLRVFFLFFLVITPFAATSPSSVQTHPAGPSTHTSNPLPPTPIVQANGQLLFPQPTSPNHWWLLDFWDNTTGANMPPRLSGEFVAVQNTIGGLVYPDGILYLPLNVAYGTSTTKCVWFQFDIFFDNAGGVQWYIWDIDCPGTNTQNYPVGDYHYTVLGLPYVVGNQYSFGIATSGSNTVTFSINDTTAGTSWSNSNWVFPVPSTKIVATDGTFSPASAVEGYTTGASLTGVPTFSTKMGEGITTNRNYNLATGEPAGITSSRSKIDLGHWIWQMASLACGPETTSDILNCNGLTPTAIVLNWGETSFTANCFGNYQLQESTVGPGGPWNSILTISSVTNTTALVTNLTPGNYYWWRIIDQANASCGSPFVASNVLQAVQPNAASLIYKPLSDTVYTLTWNNLAIYNASLSFQSYQIFESVNQGSYTQIYSTLSISTTSLNQTLASNTVYSLYLVTTDQCTTCTSHPSVTSNSTIITLQTPPVLIISVFAQRYSIDASQTDSFSCTALGGVPAYNYTWQFGDGNTATGQYVTHTYQTPLEQDVNGVFRTVTCQVADSLNTSATGYTSITVFHDPTVTLSVTPSQLDADQTFYLSAAATDGSGSNTYTWSIPVGCTTNADHATCQSLPAANYTSIVSVTDSNGFLAYSSPIIIVIHNLPAIDSFTVSTTSLDVGQTMNFTVTAFGGAQPLSYQYDNLPPGCRSANTTTLRCTPTSAGTYNVQVTVKDQAGEQDSTFASVDVNQPNQILGVPALQFSVDVGLAAAAIAVIAIGAAVVLRNKKRRGSNPDSWPLTQYFMGMIN